jgi:hypothetical protein
MVWREGYANRAWGARKPNQPGQIIELADGEAKQNYVVRIAPLGVISGVVLDEEGDPLINAQVQLLAPGYARSKPHLDPQQSTMTDDRGEFRMFNLPAGQYYVMASLRYKNAMRFQPAALPMQDAGDEGYGVQFYPGTGKLSGAGLIRLDAGKEVSGVDFRLPAIRRVHIRGKVTGPMDQIPDAQVQFTVVAQDVPDSNNFTTGAGVQMPGYTFDAPNLVPGSYLLVASLTVGDKNYRGWQKVEVNNSDIDGLTIQLLPGAELSGLVQVEGPGAEEYKHFRVALTPGDYLIQNVPQPTAESDKDLRFRFPSVVPGVWDIDVNPIPKDGYLKGMYLGDQDVLTEEMVIGPETTGPLKIVLSTQAPRVEGDVETSNPSAATRAIVLLAPDGKFKNVLSFYRVAVTDGKGHFEIKGALTPGAYKVYAFEEMEFNAFQNPEFLKPYASQGTPVQLEEGKTASVKTKVIPAEPGTRTRR